MLVTNTSWVADQRILMKRRQTADRNLSVRRTASEGRACEVLVSSSRPHCLLSHLPTIFSRFANSDWSAALRLFEILFRCFNLLCFLVSFTTLLSLEPVNGFLVLGLIGFSLYTMSTK